MSKMHRVFVQWDDGAYISSLAPDFGERLIEMVELYGRPTTVEFRADDEGWIKGGPRDAYCDPCQTEGEHSCSDDAGCGCCVRSKVLAYREGDAIFARFDLQAALEGHPGAVSRFGSDAQALREAVRLLGV